MTTDSALRKLTPPLIFGNEDQIKAVDFLGQVEECTEAIQSCPHEPQRCHECEGTGTVECTYCNEGQVKCEGCGGVGFNEESTCIKCRGAFSDEVIAAALKGITQKTLDGISR